MIQCQVGALHQSFGIGAVIGHQRNTHRGADFHALRIEPHGPKDVIEDAARKLLAVRPVVHLAEEQEFVAAEARNPGTFRQVVAQPAGNLDQDPIADLVPEEVVDFFEAVEVEPEESKPLIGIAACQLVRQHIVQARAIVQAGNDIGVREDFHFAGQLFVGFRFKDRRAQRTIDPHGDRDDRRDMQHRGKAEDAHKRCFAEQQRDAEREENHQQLAEGDERRACVARCDRRGVADRDDDQKHLRFKGDMLPDRDRRSRA